MEYYPEEIPDKQELIKLLIDLAKTTIDNTLYQTILQAKKYYYIMYYYIFKLYYTYFNIFSFRVLKDLCY